MSSCERRNTVSGVWSSELVEQTRAAIDELAFVPLGEVVHFKRADRGFGAITASDILAGRLLMVEKDTRREILYADAAALIGAGWVLD
jgi:hypothetical protein